MKTFTIHPPSTTLRDALQQKIDSKTKPIGALGQLETIALRLGLIQNTLTPQLTNPTIIVFAADHGLTAEGISPYPQDVTYQMVYNFLQGGAAINVFAKQHNIDVMVIDAGVNHDFPADTPLIHAKVGHGTRNMRHAPAMTTAERNQALAYGASIIRDLAETGCNVIGFGEMGIGNTSSSALLMSLLCEVPLEQCVGRGTGLDDAGVQHKLSVLQQTLAYHQNQWAENTPSPLEILAAVGGFEIAQMIGGMWQAAELGMTILVDGFISTAAFLVAAAVHPAIKEYTFFTHQSDENGHKRMLDYLEATPLLSLGMRLGEGSGAAVAYPLLVSATTFLREMASFESAGVSEKDV